MKEKLGISEDKFRKSIILTMCSRKENLKGRKIIKEKIPKNKKPCANTYHRLSLGLQIQKEDSNSFQIEKKKKHIIHRRIRTRVHQTS